MSLSQIDALTEVVAAVKGKMEVYLDGGIRTGNDVLKALALGAKCVFLGRPILWGLAYKVRGKPAERYWASHLPTCFTVVCHPSWADSKCHRSLRDSSPLAHISCFLGSTLHILRPPHSHLFLFASLSSQHSSNFTDTLVLPAAAESIPRTNTQHLRRMSFMLLFVSPQPPSWKQGEHGVEEVLNLIKNEFHTSMSLTGKFSQFFSCLGAEGMRDTEEERQPLLLATLPQPSDCPEERGGKRGLRRRWNTNSKSDSFAMKANEISDDGKEGPFMLQPAQITQASLLGVVLWVIFSYSWAVRSWGIMARGGVEEVGRQTQQEERSGEQEKYRPV